MTKIFNFLNCVATVILLTILGYGMTLAAVFAAVVIVPFGALNKAVEIFYKD